MDVIEFQVRIIVNTNAVEFNGKLLVLKTNICPYILNPKMLETLVIDDFDGQLPNITFTVYPKINLKTRKMVCFGYEV